MQQSMRLLTSNRTGEWGTPPEILELVREVFEGPIALDPASSEDWNQIVRAETFYNEGVDGLTMPWVDKNVFCNPPYGKRKQRSLQGLFAAKMAAEYAAEHFTEGILLVNLYWAYDWFAPLRGLPMCLPEKRIAFLNEGREAADPAKASSVFFYFGFNPYRFYRVFCKLGWCGQLERGFGDA